MVGDEKCSWWRSPVVDKRVRFIELAEKRVNRTIDDLRLRKMLER
jgi:hypothetical protein